MITQEELNKTYKSNKSGQFKIVEYNGSHKVKIRFVLTGYIAITTMQVIKSGRARDVFTPSLMSVGYAGHGRHKKSIGGVHTKAYSAWSGMIKRCYSTSRQEKQPTYKGCSVCDEWHNFQNFADWYELNYTEGFELDKDVKVKGNKVYRPDRCSFISKADNVASATSKSFRMTSPHGDKIDIFNMSKFCRDMDLSRSEMSKAASGKIDNHKGWSR